MITPLNTIKNWFKTNLKPTQAQFWAWMDSFWHKGETIPQKNIQDLQTTLDKKLDKERIPNDAVFTDTIVDVSNKTDKGGYPGTTQDLKNEFNAAQFDGAKTYQTLAEFNVVTPVPDDGTPFKIANDGDNNGDWSVVNGSPVPNDKTVSQVVEENNTSKGVSGKAVYDFVNKIYGNSAVKGANSEMNGSADWIVGINGLNFDINTTVANKMFLDFNSGINQAIKLENQLIIGDTYDVEISVRNIDATPMQLRLGANFVAGNPPDMIVFTPTDTETIFTGSITATLSTVWLGAVIVENNGSSFEVDNIKFYNTSKTSLKSLDDRLTVAEESTTKLPTVLGENIIKGTDSDMSGANGFVPNSGNLTFDVNTTVPNKLYIDFASGNQSILLPNQLTVGRSYEIVLHISASQSIQLQTGSTFVSGSNPAVINYSVSDVEQIIKGTIVASSGILLIGVLSANNNGATVEIDSIEVYDVTDESFYTLDQRLNTLEAVDTLSNLKAFNTEQFTATLSRNEKTLTKIGIVGDSLMANTTGGAIPVELDEGATRRPMRLTTNNISRRIYDLLSWNKPQHRRFDDVDWIKSGTWNTVSSAVFEGGSEVYGSSTSSGAYLEISIPDGFENFAFTCRKQEGFGVLNVTLNGSDISQYGDSYIDLNREKQNVSDFGNPFFKVVYNGLPSGVNTIRIAKESNTTEVQIFGGFYWSGNTLIIDNVSHGGHSLRDMLLQSHLQAEVIENDFDAILYQLPLMNITGDGLPVTQSEANLKQIISSVVPNKDVAFISCHPMGVNPVDINTNYYADNVDPSMEDYNLALKKIILDNNLPFVDVFSIFKTKVENRGGSLLGGEAGLWYTHDGQHQSPEGMTEFWNIIRYIFNNKPISY